jgi:hypothetical protein
MAGTSRQVDYAGAAAGQAAQKLVAFSARAGPRDMPVLVEALDYLSMIASKNFKTCERLQNTVVSLGDGTPLGDAIGICAGIALFHAAESDEDGFERLERLKKTPIRGRDLKTLINGVYGGEPEVALAGIHIGIAEYDLEQFKKMVRRDVTEEAIGLELMLR